MSTVVTFYSFKGGVGRSMALANIAILLAQRGRRVLAVDWDLEAPGLRAYFGDRIAADIGPRHGLLDLLDSAKESAVGAAAAAKWKEHVRPVDLAGTGRLDVLPAGRQDAAYVDMLGRFDWGQFFAECDGGAFIEALREEWLASYDLTLVDSRTGFTDAGGVCTIQLPDVLVAVFNANEQSLRGVTDVLEWAHESRRALAYERTPLIVLPLPSRWDGRVEVDLSKPWLDRFEAAMAPYYADWLPSGTPYGRVLELTKVPHIGKYGFGERLPALEDSLTDPDGVNVVYERVAALLDAGFKDADALLLGERRQQTYIRLGDTVDRLLDELDADVERRIARMSRLSLGLLTAAGLTLLASAVVLVAALGDFADPYSWLLSTLGGVIATMSVLDVHTRFVGRHARVEALQELHSAVRDVRVLYRGQEERQRAEYESLRDRYRTLTAGAVDRNVGANSKL